jgi:hypothetical protein
MEFVIAAHQSKGFIYFYELRFAKLAVAGAKLLE